MEPFTLAASLSVGLYSFGQAVVKGVGHYRNNNRSEAVSVDKRPYEPITSLCVAAIVPLLSQTEQLNMRFYYYEKVITLCPDTARNQIVRTWSQFTSEQHTRLQSKAWIGIVVRAICLYDLTKKNERIDAIKFVFEKAIEGLIIYLRTYKSKEESDKTQGYIVKAMNFLQCALGKIEDDEKRQQVTEELTRKIEQVKQQVKKQQLKIIDSRPFWDNRLIKSPDQDPLVNMVNSLRYLYSHKKEDGKVP